MLADQYVRNVINTHTPGPWLPILDARPGAKALVQQALLNGLPGLQRVDLSGSTAKGTDVIGGSDLDLFLSFSEAAGLLRDIYEETFEFARQNGWGPRRQRVSVGIKVAGVDIDLVPARQQPLATLHGSGDHSILIRRTGKWTKTNIEKHISLVRQSGRADEIRALKIWRNQRKLEFPSLLLEVLVVQARMSVLSFGVADRVRDALQHVASTIEVSSVMDPANSNNVLTDELTKEERKNIANAASNALASIRSGRWYSVFTARGAYPR